MALYRDIQFNKGTVTDLMGAIGTVTGATFNKDKKGWALRTGLGKYILYDKQLLPDGAFSVVAWVKCDKIDIVSRLLPIITTNIFGALGIILNSNYNGSISRPIMYFGDNNYKYFDWIADTKWHCFIFTIDGGLKTSINNAKMYVDNVEKAQMAIAISSGVPNARNIFVYAGGASAGSPIGKYDSRLKVYDHVLTQKEREREQIEFEAAKPLTYQKRLLQLPKPTELKQSGLIAAYNMKPVGNILHDIVNIPKSPDFVIPLISTGNGAGVSTLQLTVNATTTIYIDGAGKFYDDAAGTVNEGTTRTLTAGAIRTVYLKVTSGTCNITCVNGNTQITQFNGWTSSTNAASINLLNLSSLPAGITYFNCQGSNTITGNLSFLPAVMTAFYCTGANTITGNLSSLPSVMTSFYCQGFNTIAGNLSSLPAGITFFYCSGYNTIAGNLSSLPAGIIYFICYGYNTIAGNLSSLPAGMTYFICTGYNTITGNLSSLPSVMTAFGCTGSNTISDYTSGKDWANLMNYFNLVPSVGGGLDSTEIDNLIIDLDNGNTWDGSGKTLYLKGTNAAPTAASLVARNSLISKGVTITTN